MKNIKLILFLLISAFALIFVSCESKSEKEEDVKQTVKEEGEVNYEMTAPNSSEDKMKVRTKDAGINTHENTPEQKIDVTKKLIVKTGKMSLEVNSYDETEVKINEITGKFGGNIANSTSTMTSTGKKQGTIVARIPSDKFDTFVSEISQIGKVMSQNINASDVTEEYIDLEARLKTQKELEQRLYDLLKTKTSGLSDIITIENKLAEVRSKIESIEGKMKYLMSQASFSTLSISVYEPNLLQTTSGGGFFYEIGEAVVKGLRGLTSVIKFLIIAIIALFPFIILAYVIYIIVRKKIRNKKQAAK